ncbi:MAG: hypothetical protein ACP5E4_03010 [Candidatus Aenigmatarchaeota archaeon]
MIKMNIGEKVGEVYKPLEGVGHKIGNAARIYVGLPYDIGEGCGRNFGMRKRHMDNEWMLGQGLNIFPIAPTMGAIDSLVIGVPAYFNEAYAQALANLPSLGVPEDPAGYATLLLGMLALREAQAVTGFTIGALKENLRQKKHP